jgi:N-acetylglucosamine kinase-like BadF-type ATPase
VLGDEGSGYWIGREALRAVLREAELRGPRTALTPMLLEHFHVTAPQGLIHHVYHGQIKPTTIGALAACVQSAFGEGDAVAAGILENAARELEAAALSVARRLDLVGSRFPFILAGRIFRSMPWLEQELTRRLPLELPGSRVQLLTREPAEGAVALALQEARGAAQIPVYR